MQGYSGAWDLVRADVAATLRGVKQRDGFKPLISTPFDTIAGSELVSANLDSLGGEIVTLLKRRGYVTELSADQEQVRVAALTGQLMEMAVHETPAYVLAVSYDRNLACAYCFQDDLRADPANAPRLATMSVEMVDRIFAAMPEVEKRHARSGAGDGSPPRRITLFGGEPLLARFRPIVHHIARRARDIGASLSAITNGTELEHYADLVGPDGISFLQITLDGPPAWHDRRRIGKDHAPTFWKIAENIDRALSLGAQMKLRVNVDVENLSSLPDLAAIIAERGWSDSTDFSAYATPVHESTGSEHDACGFGSWTLTKALDDLAAAHPAMRALTGPDAPLQARVRRAIRGERDPLFDF